MCVLGGSGSLGIVWNLVTKNRVYPPIKTTRKRNGGPVEKEALRPRAENKVFLCQSLRILRHHVNRVREGERGNRQNLVFACQIII
jgi:hypothetical protein